MISTICWSATERLPAGVSVGSRTPKRSQSRSKRASISDSERSPNRDLVWPRNTLAWVDRAGTMVSSW